MQIVATMMELRSCPVSQKDPRDLSVCHDKHMDQTYLSGRLERAASLKLLLRRSGKKKMINIGSER